MGNNIVKCGRCGSQLVVMDEVGGRLGRRETTVGVHDCQAVPKDTDPALEIRGEFNNTIAHAMAYAKIQGLAAIKIDPQFDGPCLIILGKEIK